MQFVLEFKMDDYLHNEEQLILLRKTFLTLLGQNHSILLKGDHYHQLKNFAQHTSLTEQFMNSYPLGFTSLPKYILKLEGNQCIRYCIPREIDHWEMFKIIGLLKSEYIVFTDKAKNTNLIKHSTESVYLGKNEFPEILTHWKINSENTCMVLQKIGEKYFIKENKSSTSPSYF